MLVEKLQNIFESIGKSYELGERQVGIIIGELENVRSLVADYGESKVVEEIAGWQGSDSFEWYWMHLAGIKTALRKLEPYLESQDLTQRLYAAIVFANEASDAAVSKLEALKANTEINMNEFGFNGAKDENDLYIKIKEAGNV